MSREYLKRSACIHCPASMTLRGERWQRYRVRYRFQGGKWTTYVYARSVEEAEAKTEALRHAELEGRVGGSFSVRKSAEPAAAALVVLVVLSSQPGTP